MYNFIDIHIKLTMRDEVVWDNELRDVVISLDMTDRVMGYQSFQGASTPADAVFKSVKGWKEKRKESILWWTCFAVVLVACCPSKEVVCKLQCKLCGSKFGPANPSETAKSHLKKAWGMQECSETVAKKGKAAAL